MQYSPALGGGYVCIAEVVLYTQCFVAVQAIAMHGGYAAVAMRLGWNMRSRSRKPAGYWDSLPNVRREITAFCEDQVSLSQLILALDGRRTR